MRNSRAFALQFGLIALPLWGQGSSCVAPALSEQQIKAIIDKARATRTDVTAPFAKQRTTLRRQGCHYIYTEESIPAAPEHTHIFKLNQYGAIVDFQPGNPKCPDKVFSEAELAEIVAKERAKRQDLPAPFPRSRIRIERSRCLYLYFEYSVPESRGNYQVFTVDPLGEVMDVIRPDPY